MRIPRFIAEPSTKSPAKATIVEISKPAARGEVVSGCSMGTRQTRLIYYP
ncbi:MAG: hypothetical protein ACFB0G_07075 [Leptolyngbyaceae cyanobacterium]